MAIANIKTSGGTKITIEGTPEEISKVLDLYGIEKKGGSKTEFKKFVKQKPSSKPTVTDITRELLAEGFFNKPKGLAELKQGLEEQGCFVPITTLSGITLGLVKSRELRRIKQGKKWTYAKR